MPAKYLTAFLFLIGALLGAAAVVLLRRPSVDASSSTAARPVPTAAPAEAVLTEAPPAAPPAARATEAAGFETADKPPSDADPLAKTVAWLRERFPATLSNLTPAQALELKSLDFHGLAINDADLALLAPLVQLEELGLRGTAVTDAGLAHLSGLAQLKGIGLRGTKVDGRGLSALPAGLERLDLTDTQVTEAALGSLSGRHALSNVNLNRLALGDSAVAMISTIPGLAKVELDGTAITDAGLRQLIADNPRLLRVEVRDTKTSVELADELRARRSGLEIVQQQGAAGFSHR